MQIGPSSASMEVTMVPAAEGQWFVERVPASRGVEHVFSGPHDGGPLRYHGGAQIALGWDA